MKNSLTRIGFSKRKTRKARRRFSTAVLFIALTVVLTGVIGGVSALNYMDDNLIDNLTPKNYVVFQPSFNENSTKLNISSVEEFRTESGINNEPVYEVATVGPMVIDEVSKESGEEFNYKASRISFIDKQVIADMSNRDIDEIPDNFIFMTETAAAAFKNSDVTTRDMELSRDQQLENITKLREGYVGTDQPITLVVDGELRPIGNFEVLDILPPNGLSGFFEWSIFMPSQLLHDNQTLKDIVDASDKNFSTTNTPMEFDEFGEPLEVPLESEGYSTFYQYIVDAQSDTREEEILTQFKSYELCDITDIQCFSGDEKFDVVRLDGSSSYFYELARGLSNVIKIFGLILTAVASLLVASTISSAITDSNREIAVFRVLGARMKHLLVIYGSFALSIVAQAFIAALAASYLLLFWLSSSIGDSFAEEIELLSFNSTAVNANMIFVGFPVVELVSIIAIVVLILVVALVLPLWRLQRIKPASALRNE